MLRAFSPFLYPPQQALHYGASLHMVGCASPHGSTVLLLIACTVHGVGTEGFSAVLLKPQSSAGFVCPRLGGSTLTAPLLQPASASYCILLAGVYE